jgi:hypothetical protein
LLPSGALLSATALLVTGCADEGGEPVRGGFSVTYRRVEVSAFAGLEQWRPTRLVDTPCQGNAMDTGGGVVEDVDGDGLLDIVLPRMRLEPMLLRGRGGFEFAAEPLGGPMDAAGAVVWDATGDGRRDILLTAMSGPGNRLLVQQPDGGFNDEAEARGLLGGDATGTSERCRGYRSGSLGDVDADGWIDLYLTRWDLIDSSLAGRLFAGGAEGRFVDITEAAGLGQLATFGYAASLEDFDGDGRLDLAVAGDFDTTRIFRGVGGRRFDDVSTAWGIGTGENGMGALAADFDGDGDLDWMVTGIARRGEDASARLVCGIREPACDGNRLYRNDLPVGFTRVERDAGVDDGSWGWGLARYDADLDGDADLVQATGYFSPFVEGARPEDVAPFRPYELDPARLWLNDGAWPLREAAAGVGLDHLDEGRTVIAADFDDDGDLDLLITNSRLPPVIYEAETTGGTWLSVTLAGPPGNVDGIGAWVEVTAGGRTQRQQIDGNSSYLGHGPREARFTFGTHRALGARVRVTWPDGSTTERVGVTTGRALRVAWRG